MDLQITFLGTAASTPSAARGVAATLVSRGGARLLVDCGEGTQRQLLRSGVGLVDVDLIYLTHLHGDHVLGLPGMLKTFALRDRERDLPIVGPVGTAALMERLRPLIGRVGFAVEVEELRAGGGFHFDGARIEAVATEHGVASIGFLLAEPDRPGMFDLDAARALGIPSGPLFGRLQRGERVELEDGRTIEPEAVVGQSRAGRRILLTGDTRGCEAVAEAAQGASLLVHEATFLHEDAERAAETSHATARDAALVALAADVGLLALTHLSSRVLWSDARHEAAEVFPRVVVPRDFDRIDVPFPERGDPNLVPWPGRAGGGGMVPRETAPEVPDHL